MLPRLGVLVDGLAVIFGMDGYFFAHLKQPRVDANADAVKQCVGDTLPASRAAGGCFGWCIGQILG